MPQPCSVRVSTALRIFLVPTRDSKALSSPDDLRSSNFAKALTSAGGVFGSGGPCAFQLGLRFQF